MDEFDFDECRALLAHLKIHADACQPEDEWTPLREAWRGEDHTLGNRWQERQVFVQGQALSGHANAGDVVKELEAAGFAVLGYVETAQSEKRPQLTVIDIGRNRNQFHGFDPSTLIDVAVQITFVVFRQAPTPRVPVESSSRPGESTPAG